MVIALITLNYTIEFAQIYLEYLLFYIIFLSFGLITNILLHGQFRLEYIKRYNYFESYAESTTSNCNLESLIVD